MILQSLKMAVKSILNNKMRSFLTMLGIIIGVFSLVVLVSLVSGATGSITESIQSLGTNLLNVNVFNDHGHPLKMADLDDLVELDELHAAAPNVQTQVKASAGYEEKSVTVFGTTAAYREIQDLKLAHGRFLLKPDEDNHSNVVVLNHKAATELLGRSNVVGETIRLQGTPFRIIGVLEPPDSGRFTMGAEELWAYIPFSSLVRLTEDIGRTITAFDVAAAEEDMKAAEEAVNDWLSQRIAGVPEEDFYVFNQSSIAETMGEVTSTLSLLLGGIAAISLLVGGIGIMNIMLVSVTERTREIGIRKAIGAKRRTIMLQFLIEALMVSLIGCLLGILFSWVALQIIDRVGGVSYGVDPGVAILSILFSLGIGVLFGLYPASKAARKKPIDALRYN